MAGRRVFKTRCSKDLLKGISGYNLLFKIQNEECAYFKDLSVLQIKTRQPTNENRLYFRYLFANE